MLVELLSVLEARIGGRRKDVGGVALYLDRVVTPRPLSGFSSSNGTW